MSNIDNIEVSLARVSEIIERIGGSEFSTADVLREYSGGFYSNKSTPAYYSFNAQFGKLLSRNASLLKIREVQENTKVSDDNGHKTSSSTWKFEN
ncbi:hypothetical protein [Plesiomonas shigelloides]|uniref:hypothetical protein n=1 Tax=Plesiomonas shigelloides TaxID=703 RepID=UPI00326169BE